MDVEHSFGDLSTDVPLASSVWFENDSISDQDSELPHEAELLLLSRNCLAVPLGVAILLSNSLVIACVLRRPPVQGFTTLLLVFLCTGDLFTGGVLLTMVVAGQTSSAAPEGLCAAIVYMEPILAVLSVTQTFAINFDRFLCLQFPLRYHSLIGIHLLLLLIVPPWLLACVQLVTTHLAGEINTSPACVFYPPGRIPMLVTTFFFLVPFVGTCVLYGFIWRIVNRHFEFVAALARESECCRAEGCACLKNKPSKIFHLKVVRTIAVIVSTLLLTSGPYVIATLAYNYVSDDTKETLAFYVIPLAELLIFTKSAINPWLFAFSYPKFKKALAELLRKPCGERTSWKRGKTAIDTVRKHDSGTVVKTSTASKF